jgi:hypothetical protein
MSATLAGPLEIVRISDSKRLHATRWRIEVRVNVVPATVVIDQFRARVGVTLATLALVTPNTPLDEGSYGRLARKFVARLHPGTEEDR